MNHHGKLAGLLLAGWLALPANALAITYGNPAQLEKRGEFYAGLSLFETERKTDAISKLNSSIGPDQLKESIVWKLSGQYGVLGYWIADHTAVEFAAGNFSIESERGAEYAGNSYGLVFRSQGILAAFHQGVLEDDDGYWEGDFKQIDLGYGISGSISEKADIYGAIIFSKFSAELDATDKNLAESSALVSAYYGFPITISSYSGEIEEDSTFGFAVGVELNPTENIRVSFEMHAMFETGFGLRLIAGF